MTGSTQSMDFPVTSGAFQSARRRWRRDGALIGLLYHSFFIDFL
ncbi:hypothetical protein [Mechercharimyces sp. CAU 1602]